MTTYKQRFEEAIALLCAKPVPEGMVDTWLNSDSLALQDFAASNGPSWCQGIVLIEAADLLASEPEEGKGHKYND